MTKFTDKQAAFIDFLFGEAKGNVRKAARMAGYSDNTPAHQIIGPIKDKLKELTEHQLFAGAIEASFTMQKFLDEKEIPTIGDKERFAAAKDLLDRGGFKPKEEIEVETSNPLFILPEKRND